MCLFRNKCIELLSLNLIKTLQNLLQFSPVHLDVVSQAINRKANTLATNGRDVARIGAVLVIRILDAQKAGTFLEERIDDLDPLLCRSNVLGLVLGHIRRPA